MCSERGRALLERFIDFVTVVSKGGENVHLVIAGDIVDFLAEDRAGSFSAFTGNDKTASEKLGAILGDVEKVVSALSGLLRSGARLTMLLGNHDIELSLPGPRRLLLDALGAGRVEFIYDNQALSIGRVLIEHGNRYDAWNAVGHDELRAARSRVSRRGEADFSPLPGSQMVVDLVNPLKEDLAFVDLLKPEDAALLPFLALLAPNRFGASVTTLKNRVRSMRVQYDSAQQPKDRNFIAAAPEADASTPGVGTGDADDDALLDLAERLAAGGDSSMVSSVNSFLDRWRSKISTEYRARQLDLLLAALRSLRNANANAFDIGFEEHKYLDAAVESATRGYDVVVYGHTHLPKRVELEGRTVKGKPPIERRAVYLNSGTWADIMCIPSSMLSAESGARTHLEGFADDLAKNRLDGWRRLLPTFVEVDIDDEGAVKRSELKLFDEAKGPVTVSNELLRRRLDHVG